MKPNPGTPLCEVRNCVTLQEIASGLYQLLDDIDTFSDVAHDDNVLYRRLTEKRQQLKQKFLCSDGHDLFVPDAPIPKLPDILNEIPPHDPPQSLREHANDCMKPTTDLDCVGTEGGKVTTTTLKP